MKQLFKNRAFAAVVLAVVFIASLFIGTNVSISRNVKHLDNLYREGMKSVDGTYTKPSISSQVDASMDYALGLYTIAVNYAEYEDVALWAERLKAEREGYLRLRDSFSPPRFTMIMKNSTSYYVLYDAAQNLLDALHSRVALTISDAEAIAAYFADLRGANELIKELAAEYNIEVAAALKAAETFPTRLFCSEKNSSNLHYSAFPGVIDIQWHENGWSAGMEEV